MEDNVIEFQDTRSAWQKAKDWGKQRYDKAKTWCKENKELVITIAPMAIGGLFELGKLGMKYRDKAAERELEAEKLKTVYDRSLGAYVKTRRPLNNDDLENVQRLKRRGYTEFEALRELGLLA